MRQFDCEYNDELEDQYREAEDSEPETYLVTCKDCAGYQTCTHVTC